jgi:hypothetical protein
VQLRGRAPKGGPPGRVRRASLLALEREDIFGLTVEPSRAPVDDLQVAPVLFVALCLREIAAQRGLSVSAASALTTPFRKRKSRAAFVHALRLA